MTLYLFCLATKGIFLLLVYGLRKLVQRGEIEMPSEKTLSAKKERVAQLVEMLKNSAAGVLVDYKGITVEEDTKLRKELRENDVKYTVVKNTLLSRACEEAGLDDIKPVLEGTTAIATSDSEYAAAARILCNYAKDHDNFKVKSAYLDGAVIDMDTIVALSKLPTREVLLANVLGAFQAPIASFARAVQAIVDKGGVETCAAEAAEEAPAEAEAPAAE